MVLLHPSCYDVTLATYLRSDSPLLAHTLFYRYKAAFRYAANVVCKEALKEEVFLFAYRACVSNTIMRQQEWKEQELRDVERFLMAGFIELLVLVDKDQLKQSYHNTLQVFGLEMRKHLAALFKVVFPNKRNLEKKEQSYVFSLQDLKDRREEALAFVYGLFYSDLVAVFMPVVGSEIYVKQIVKRYLPGSLTNTEITNLEAAYKVVYNCCNQSVISWLRQRLGHMMFKPKMPTPKEKIRRWKDGSGRNVKLEAFFKAMDDPKEATNYYGKLPKLN